ncbi:hypothetical protein CO110_10320 [Candidatus Desantisbacteria bacterium CG_4_9_14_3_um_filter_40_11]|uniref:Polymerase nucleotidyl transferase domain-containing protein n=2 Tax=unclassified Candidatus Desantisiibacteriota TaxID=3106372 RepID=A0A2M8AR76_9BACT|nr:MAG: hypothetical protein CO110_10320 [Candidatus Desantisbacteria bacterium CG_4_9_14_3_um_filter_40_11]
MTYASIWRITMNKANFLTERENKIVNRFSSNLKKVLGENLIRIRLIGSKARGDFDRDSDIDILIIVKDYFLNKEKAIDILYSIDPYYENRISPIIYSEFEYEKNKELQSPFVEKVEREGADL